MTSNTTSNSSIFFIISPLNRFIIITSFPLCTPFMSPTRNCISFAPSSSSSLIIHHHHRHHRHLSSLIIIIIVIIISTNNTQMMTETAEEGGSIYTLTKHEMSEPIIAYIVKHVLMALQFIHSKFIVHRNIKTKNLIFESSRVKLGFDSSHSMLQ